MKKKSSFDLKMLEQRTVDGFKRLSHFTVVFYILLLAFVYGYVLLKASQLVNSQPTSSDISSKIQATDTPHVDTATVKQMQSLNDNSVRVQSLFDQARSNPFQE